MRLLAVSIALLALTYPSYALLSRRFRHGVKLVNLEKSKHVFENDNSTLFRWFSQWKDHLDPYGSGDTWQQRYQVNDTYGTPDGPAFLLLGGEGPIGAKFLSDSALMDTAKLYGATVFQLEHRFYGESQPFGDTSTNHLRLLHSQQALADAAWFVQWVNSKRSPYNNISNNSKWVVFGGSYSGALSAWMRLKYPHLIAGSVASSAPVHIVVDFSAYLQVVQTSLSTTNHGALCVKRIAKATKEIERLIVTEEGRQEVAKELKLCAPIRESSKFISDQVGRIMSDVADFIEGTVQYSGDNRDGSVASMQDICDVMANTSYSALHQLGKLSDWMLDTKNESCVDTSYDTMVEGLRNASIMAGPDRTWWWQTCNEFAYFQTTDAPKSTQPFHRIFPLNFSYNVCHDVFGVDPNQIRTHIQHTRTIYGDSNIRTSNTIFINGLI
eukprot:Ihof_evm1s589 gene=Ihof_evmTU1s589